MTGQGTHLAQLRVRNFGSIRDATFALSPLHAFVGPNDSGKSTILRAVMTTLGMANVAFLPASHPSAVLPGLRPDTQLEVRWRDRYGIALARVGGYGPIRAGRSYLDEELELESGTAYLSDILSTRSVATRLLTLDPRVLRAPSSLIPTSRGVDFADERGAGLASVLDAISTRDVDAWIELRERVRALFPWIDAITLEVDDGQQKVVSAKLRDGTRVGAHQLSEGLFYYLAFAALQHLTPVGCLLIEEPENGLHPARIAEVVKVLRELSKHTTVLFSTHSPLILNELEPHEITVVTRPPDRGTIGQLLKDTPRYEERAKVYANGELWLSYCDGELEAPLLDARSPT